MQQEHGVYLFDEFDAIKKAILADESKVNANALIAAIRNRQLFRQGMPVKK